MQIRSLAILTALIMFLSCVPLDAITEQLVSDWFQLSVDLDSEKTGEEENPAEGQEAGLVWTFGEEQFVYLSEILDDLDLTIDSLRSLSVQVGDPDLVSLHREVGLFFYDWRITANDYFDQVELTVRTRRTLYTILLKNPAKIFPGETVENDLGSFTPLSPVPAGTALLVGAYQPNEDERNQILQFAGEEASLVWLDIGLFADEKKVEAGATVTVNTDIDFSEAASGTDLEGKPVLREVRLFHLTGNGEAEELAVEPQVEGTSIRSVTFTAESFSPFVIAYTVDFTYSVDGREYAFTLPGGKAIPLSGLVDALHIHEGTHFENATDFVSHVENVTFSNSALLAVYKAETDTTVGEIRDALGLTSEYSAYITEEEIAENNAMFVSAGDWALISLQAFDTDETLIISMDNGDVITVNMTDAAILVGDNISASLIDGASWEDNHWVWTVNDRIQPGHEFVFRVNYSFSTYEDNQTVWQPGQIQLKIPKSILLNRVGQPADGYTISVPNENTPGLSENNLFVYKEEGDNIVIHNRLSTTDLTQVGYIEVSYITNESSFSYGDDGSEKESVTAVSNPFSATLTIVATEEEGGQEIRSITASPILVSIDTAAVITKTEKQKPMISTGWNESWGKKPENMESKSEGTEEPEYYYFIWPVRSDIIASQPYTFSLEDTFNMDYGEVVGYRFSGNGPFSNKNSTEVLSQSRYSTTRTDYVLTRIEKQYYDALLAARGEDGEYTLQNDVIAKVTPADEHDEATSASSSYALSMRQSAYISPAGNFWGGKRGLTTSYDLEAFLDDSKKTITGLQYLVTMDGNSYAYTYQYGGEETETDLQGKDLEENHIYYPNFFEIIGS